MPVSFATRAVPGGDLDAVVAELAESILANHPDSITACKDLYRNQQDVGLTAGLDFEYTTRYDIASGGDRVAGFGSR